MPEGLEEARTETAEAGTAAQTGPDVIRGYVAGLRAQPGVYRMMGSDGAVLYVGKARSLKKRVASYTSTAKHANRIARMIQATASIGHDGHRDRGAAARV